MDGPRVCYVVNSVGETSVPATIAGALQQYTDVTVDLLAWFSADRFEDDDGLDVTCVNAPSTTFGIDRSTYRTACNALEAYDLIQAHHPHSGTFAKIIARRLGIPSVSREGNTRDGFTRKGRIANGLTNPLSAYVVPNSRAVYNSFTRWENALLSESQIRIIPNGVDLDRVRRARNLKWSVRETCDVDPETVLVGNASMFTEQKAHDVLVRALATANERSDRRYELAFAGDGQLRDDIEALARSEGVGEYVHFLGLLKRDRVYRMMDELDIYAMPSRWEGFSNAAVEALVTGTPCVFSDIEPFLLPYRNVSLFHRLDNPIDLAEQLVELGENPDLRKRYGRKGRELVERKYTLERVAEQYADLYREIVCE